MSDNKQHFSLAIEKESRDTLNIVTKSYGLTQSEIVEALMMVIKNNPENTVLSDAFKLKRKEKEAQRAVKHIKKAGLRKALSKISEDELEKILSDKGLL